MIHHHRTIVGKQAGAGVIIVMSAIVPLAILTSSIVALLASRTNDAQSSMARERLLASAESALFEGLAMLNTGASLSAFPLADASLQHASDGIDNDGDGQIDEADEIGQVRILLDWSNDGRDNDLDGHIDEDDEQVICLVLNPRRDEDGIDNDGDGFVDDFNENSMLKLTGIAQPFLRTAGAREKRVEAYIQNMASLFPSPPAALYLGDPNSKVSFNGNSFIVSGIDRDMTGTLTGAKLPGIGVEGPTATLIDSLKNNQLSLIRGDGGLPSIKSVTVPNPFGLSTSFIGDWIDLYRSFAQHVIEGGSAVSANPQGKDGLDNDGDGLVDEEDESYWGGGDAGMKVTYVPGDVHFSGTGRGYGLLLVDGTVRISGQFRWDGIMVVRGNLEFTGGGKESKQLLGSAFVQGNVQEKVPNILTISGNIEISCSQQRLDLLAKSLGRWRLWAFQEDLK